MQSRYLSEDNAGDEEITIDDDDDEPLTADDGTEFSPPPQKRQKQQKSSANLNLGINQDYASKEEFLEYVKTVRTLSIDEYGLMDLIDFSHLLKSLPNLNRLILLGDPQQLLSVGPGNLLDDFVKAMKDSRHRENVMELTKVHRFQDYQMNRNVEILFSNG